MMKSIFFLFGFTLLPLFLMASDCEFLSREMTVFYYVSPAPISLYYQDLKSCGVEQINGVYIDDYFKLESNVRLSYVYRSFKLKKIHPVLLNYVVTQKRWDLLLKIFDFSSSMNRKNQIALLNTLFYENLPGYFNVEMKEMFNFFSQSEKLTASQQLIPNTLFKLKHLNKQNNYIFEYWPLFDQMVFINHLKEFYPSQFEKFSTFWREELVKYYYDRVESKDASFKLLNLLLTNEQDLTAVTGANESLQAYYYLKRSAYNQLSPILEGNKEIFFNLLRYFNLYKPEQQSWLLSFDTLLSISDIEYLFNDFFFQVNNLSFRSWLWEKAIAAKFNFELYIDNPNQYLDALPHSKISYLKILSPTKYEIRQNINGIQKYFNKNPKRFINDPFNYNESLTKLINPEGNRSRQQVLSAVFPLLELDSFNDFLNIIPYTNFADQLILIQNNELLDTVPIKDQAKWNRVSQPWLKYSI